ECTADTCDPVAGCQHTPVANGTPCNGGNGTCQNGMCSSVTCDCSNLNYCSGHGTCTPLCICACEPGWSGVACTDQAPVDCSQLTACSTCQDQAAAGCVWCAQTLGGASGVCTSADQCLSPQVAC